MPLRIVRSHGPGRLFASLVSSPLSCCRLRAFAWLSGYEENDQDRFFRASVKEGAKSTTRNEFHRWALELPSLSPCRGFATATERERVVFCSPQLPTAFLVSFPNRGAFPDLPLRALAPARAFCAPLFVGVTNSRFVFRRVSPLERSNNRPSPISATESDARARPELPYLLRSSQPSFRSAAWFFTEMSHARVFPLSVTDAASCDATSAFIEGAVPSAASSAEPLARLCAAFFFPVFSPPFGRTLRESGDVEQLRARRPVRCRKLHKPCGLAKQHGPRPPSKGPTHLLRSAARFWRAPSPGERCAWAPLLRKTRAPSVVGMGLRKAWKAFLMFSTPTGDLRSLAAPRREALSRKSGCLGRAVSLTSRRRNLLRRPTGPLRTPLVLEHCPENAAPFLPPALPGVDAPSGGQMARSRPTHRISVGSDVGAAPGNDLYVSMQPAD